METETVRYVLSPGLELIPGHNGGLLLSLRPLLALRLNPQAFALLALLDKERSADEVAQQTPGLSAEEAMAFFDSLAQRRLVECQPPTMVIWPRVSIIVPARGRGAATRTCVKSLLALDYPTESREIIVVDDASEPPLAAYLDDLPVRLLRQDHNIGQSAARNRAAKEAQGELLAFIDNDCIADPAWLKKLVPYINQPQVAIAGGRVIAPVSEGTIGAFEALRSPLDMGSVAAEVGPQQVVPYLPTCNFMVRRHVLLEQDGFDEQLRLGEDVDFIWRTLRSGQRAWYTPAAQVIHYHRVQLPALLRRRADYASSEAHLQTRHQEGRRIMPLPRVSLLLFAMLMAFPMAWPVGATLGAVLLLLVLLEVNQKSRKLQKAGAVVSKGCLYSAVLREHAASFHHLSADITRYYSLPLLFVIGLLPAYSPAVIVLLLTAPIGDYYRLKPNLSLAAFMGLYGLEMVAYQLGLWRGCLRERTLLPLLPRLRWRP
jgi:mycofactocin system glycosyltransferase